MCSLRERIINFFAKIVSRAEQFAGVSRQYKRPDSFTPGHRECLSAGNFYITLRRVCFRDPNPPEYDRLGEGKKNALPLTFRVFTHDFTEISRNPLMLFKFGGN